MYTAQYWIDHLQLIKHPEGGYYRELYRCRELAPHESLPARFTGPRSFATSIVYLLEGGDYSAFHRIRSDETWHFYGGDALELFQLDEDQVDDLKRIEIGRELHLDQQIQWTVPAGVWFAARVCQGGGFSVLGCSVSPGFDFADFELADRAQLAAKFPKWSELIGELSLRWGK